MGSAEQAGLNLSAEMKALEREFGELPPQEIEQLVDKLVRQWSGARVTNFLPLLVERYAREELRGKVRNRESATG